jgi:hypothetical protein
MNGNREQLLGCVAELFDADVCADQVLGYIERSSPALLYYVERKAAGVLSKGHEAYEKFLRSMPESLFDHIFDRALLFFERYARNVEAPEKQDPEFCALSTFLWFDERGIENHCGTDEEWYALMERLASLTVLEEQERVGVGSWVAYYESLERTLGRLSLQYPVTQWLTPN